MIRVIISPGSPPKPDTRYKIMDMSLEYEIITQPDLARYIALEYKTMALPYDRVLRDTQILVNRLWLHLGLERCTWSWTHLKDSTSIILISLLFSVPHYDTIRHTADRSGFGMILMSF